jgi:hypothetical protein
MSDAPKSKRFAAIGLSITAFIATLIGAGAGYYFQQKKTAEVSEIPVSAKKVASVINTIKTPEISEVLTTLFEVKTTSDKVANAKDQLSSLWFSQSFKQNKEEFHAVFIKTQSIDAENNEVVDSHATAANISVVVYKLVDKQWQLFSKQINVGSFGSWGDAPAIENATTLQLSPNNIAFLIDSGFSGQGYTEEGKGLFSFNPKTKTWKDLGFVQTGGDNGGACDDEPKPKDDLLSACWEFTGEISLSKTGKNPDYPDLVVKHKGTTSSDNNKILPVRDRRYVFNGEQYIATDAEAR